MKKILFIFFVLTTGLFLGQNLSSSLTACYALDGNANDPISNLTGTLSAVTPTVNRFNVSNSAYHFTGSTSSYIRLPNSPLLKPTNALSFSAWVRADDMNSPHYLLYAGNGCSSQFEGYALTIENMPVGYRFAIAKASANCAAQALLISNTTLVAQTWYHVGLYVGNDSIKIYLNGIPDGSTSITVNAFGYSPTQNVFLGGTTISFWNYPFRGTFDNVRFYNRKLTNAEFNLLYTTDPSCILPPMLPTAASFIAPSTVCVNQSFTVQNTSSPGSGTINSYYWNACNNPVSAPTQTFTTGSLTTLNNPVFLSVNADGPNYYAFVSNNTSSSLTRLSYGNSLNNTPVVTNLALGSNIQPNPEGLWIEKEGANWYGLMVGGPSGSSRISRLNFGTSLANIPTVTNMGNIGSLDYPMDIQIFRNGGNVYGLTMNSLSNTITRFDFGNSIANAPTASNLGNLGNLNVPSDFSFINSGGNWYAYICNDGSSTITRLDFGTSLTNAPIGTNIGNTGSLSGPRAISVWLECGQLKGSLVSRNTNQMLDMNFASGPTGPISTSPSGVNANFNFAHSAFKTRVNDAAVILFPNVNSNSVSRIDYPTCNSIPSSTLPNPPAMTFTAPGTYTISLICNEGLFDQSSYCQTITVLNAPSVAASATPSIICAGNSVVLSASGASSYTWEPGSLVGSTVTISPTSSLTYTVSDSTSGCISSATVAVVVIPSTLIITASANPASICAGNSATLTASGGTSYTWQPGASQGSSSVVSPTSSTTYTVTDSSSGCNASATVTVTVIPTPTLTAAANPTSICSGSSITLTATGASSYTWLPVNLTGSTIVVNPTSAIVYTVIGANGSCTASANVTITNTYPTSILQTGSLCYNSTSTLSVLIPLTANSFSWTGPGIIGSNTTQTIQINSGGIYSVVVTDTLTNCFGTATANISGSSSPLILNIIPSSTVTCFPGPPVNMLVSASANMTWFPASEVTPSTGPLVSVSPSVTSTYTVFGSAGVCSGSTAITISVNITPTLTNVSGDIVICERTPAVLSASGAADYSWLPGNLSGASVTVSPGANTIYTVTGANGNCTATGNSTVTVLAAPILTTSVVPPIICIGHTSSLTVSGANGYTWHPFSAPEPTTAIIAVTPTVSSVYSVSGTNSVGCISTRTLLLTVINSPAIGATVSRSVICSGESVTLTASGASSYTWLPVNLTGSSIIQAPAFSTSYTVVSGNSTCSYATLLIIVTNCSTTAFGLTNAAEKPVTFNANFYKISFMATAVNSSSSDLTEVALTNDLNATFAPPSSFTVISPPTIVSMNSALSTNPFYNGASDINLISPSSSTLLANKRDTLVFTIVLDPKGYYGPVKNSMVGFAKAVNNFILADSSNTGFAWDPDNDGDPTNNNQVTIIDIELIDLFIPTGFTPNDDGNYDKFVISGLNNRPVNLTVFNRWGNKVYYKSNYDNSWDGTANAGGLIVGSGKLPQATYYYVVEFLDGNKETRSGFVVLQY